MVQGIRDFIYLDVERVRSIVAQVAGGLVSERRSEAQHDAGAKVGGEGGLPFVAKASGEADYHYSRMQSETRSLHDALFAEFYDYLQNASCFFDQVCPTPSNWERETFKDGGLLVVNGVVRIIDYGAQSTFMNNLPTIYEAARQANSGRGTEEPPAEQFFADWHFKELTTILNTMYRSVIRIKVFPFPDENGLVFVGSGDKGNFRIEPENLMQQYGRVIDAGWHTVLQVNIGEEPIEGTYVTQTGNQLEDKLEGLMDILTRIVGMAQQVRFPAVAMLPIAIYRDI